MIIKRTAAFSQLMCSHKKISSQLGCLANKENKERRFRISPFPAASSIVWQVVYTHTTLPKKNEMWLARTRGRYKFHPTWNHLKSIWQRGEKLLEEKTFSTDGFDSVVNNCSVKYDNQEPHQQFFDSSHTGEAWIFQYKGPKGLVVNGLWFH